MSEIDLLHQYMKNAHQIDDLSDLTDEEGEIPHERMANFTMDKIMSTTGMKMAKLRQVIMASQDYDIHNHPHHPPIVTRRGIKVPGYTPEFGEE